MGHQNKSTRHGRHSTIIPSADPIVAYVQKNCGAKVTFGLIRSENPNHQKILLHQNSGRIEMNVVTRTGVQQFFISNVTLQKLFEKLFEQFSQEFEVTLR